MKPLRISNRITNKETDSFKKYLKDISLIPMFTPEEELICTKKASKGDKSAKDELINRNLRFVVSVAKQYATPVNTLEDLVNEGNIGLIMAADKFKPEMGFKFISYAVHWVKKIILEYLAKNGRMVRLPANKITNLSKLNKQISDLEQKLGRNVEIQEIIDEFGEDSINDDFYLLDLLGTYNVDSLDREIGDDNHTTLCDLISNDSDYDSSDHLLIDADVKFEINRIINTLKPRDKRVMIAIYGLDGNTPMALKEIGEELGVSREMVRQIKEKTLLGLKNKLKNSTVNNY